jgi:hypothetical protein
MSQPLYFSKNFDALGGRGDRVRHDGEGVVGEFGVRATHRSGESNFFTKSSASLRSVASGSWYRYSFSDFAIRPSHVPASFSGGASGGVGFRDTPHLFGDGINN